MPVVTPKQNVWFELKPSEDLQPLIQRMKANNFWGSGITLMTGRAFFNIWYKMYP